MGVRIVPETFNRQDWPRIVSGAFHDVARDIASLVAGALTDGDKGDVTVSGGGAVWTIDNGAVGLNKLANVATATVFYRKTAGAGAPEVQTLATLKTDLGLAGTNSGDQTSVSGNAGTATALATGRTIAMTGDVAWVTPAFDGTGNVTAAGTLATVNSNVGSFGSATLIPVVTVNGKGLITAISTVAASGGGGLGGLTTVTIPSASYEWEETVVATGVTGASRIILGLAPALDADENDPAFLAVSSLSALPGTGQMTVSMAFAEPARGPIKLNWSAM